MIRRSLTGEGVKISNGIILGAVLSCGSQLSYSADTNGHFQLGGGVGAVTCPKFVESMEHSRSLGIGSVDYAYAMQGFIMYLMGFQTGYNASALDTCDIFSGTDTDYSLLSWAENFCRTNPSRRFADAVLALSLERHPERQRVCSR